MDRSLPQAYERQHQRASGGALPQRGAFSVHMLLDPHQPGGAESLPSSSPSPRRSSAPHSALSSPYSRYEYAPDLPRTPAPPMAHIRVASPSPLPPPPPPVRPPPPVASSGFSNAVMPLPPRPHTVASAPRTGLAGARGKGNSVAAHAARTSPLLPVSSSPRSKIDKRVSAAGDRTRQLPQQQRRDEEREEDDHRESCAATSSDTQHTSPLSIRPIDTLAKKLRLQAKELTTVYEQLEKASQRVRDQDAQIHALTCELERAKSAKQTAAAAGGSTKRSRLSGAAKASAGASDKPPTRSTTSVASAKELDQLRRKVQELEREREQFARVERVLEELKTHREIRQCESSGGADNSSSKDSDAPQEQQLYIRVLEEAVHLKASELNVTGHEELLVVLAELRHTIYEQEQDVAHKQQRLDALSAELQTQQSQHVALQEQLDAKSTARALELHELRQANAMLTTQLEQHQRELERLRTTAADSTDRESHLREQLASVTQLRTLAESKRETLAHSLAECEAALARSTRDCERERASASQLRDEVAAKQAQLHEVKALQDELLATIDSYARKAESAVRESERLHGQLQSSVAKLERCEAQQQAAAAASDAQYQHVAGELDAVKRELSETQTARDTAAQTAQMLQQQLEQQRAETEHALDTQSLELQSQARALQASEQASHVLHDCLRELDAAIAAAVDTLDRERVDDDDGFDTASQSDSRALEAELTRCAQSLCDVVDAAHDSATGDALVQQHVSALAQLLAHMKRTLATASAHIVSAHASWHRERAELDCVCAELDATARVCHEEMQRAHEKHLRAQEQLAQASLEVTARTHDVAKLQYALDERSDELAALRDCAQHVPVLEQHVQTLARKLQDAEVARDTQSQTLALKTQQLERMASELEALAARYERVECALETAVELAEQQNVKHEQLLARLEDASERESKQSASLHALVAREAALAEHVRSLVRQCAALAQQQQQQRMCADDGDDHHDNDSDSGGSSFARVQLLLYEAQRGDVMRMLELLPAVLGDAVAAQTTVRNNVSSRASDVEGKRKRVTLPATKAASATSEAPTRVRAPAIVKSAAPQTPHAHAVDPDAACFQEQLELIHEAFGAFRAAEIG